MTAGLDAGADIARYSLEAATGAALALSALGLPAAWPLVPSFFMHQYDPQVFWDGGMAWTKVAEDMRQARADVEKTVKDVTHGDAWHSEDGRAFDQRMDRYLRELLSIEIRAVAVAAVLFLTALLTMAVILFMALLAAVLVALAAWVAVATVFPLSAALARITALNAIIEMTATLKEVEAGLNTTLHLCAGILGTLIAGDVFVGATQGGFGGLKDFIDGTIAQGPLLVWGTANRIERDATAWGIGGRFPEEGVAGRIAGDRAGTPLPPGLPQAAGAKGVNDVRTGGQTVTGGLTPGRRPDGSYPYPWE
ncbi:hypothetical protein [Actinomadura harenae]|uniref:Uncharacterized protein n=1 Tax=Actinomadura harenae TaxID=2483351 RepID=A0A3M2L4N2_9ACTN|nr:hypothetical protein [Actinomadura harenae]RMI32531.1 hypothetical protein EBO15_41855 [Actinomadura harenae]